MGIIARLFGLSKAIVNDQIDKAEEINVTKEE